MSLTNLCNLRNLWISSSDGPFAETKELVAGYWLWQVKSKEEARGSIRARRGRAFYFVSSSDR